MRKDSHAFYRELVAARLDRHLSRVELRTLTAHVKSCPACAEVDREYREQRLELRAMPQPIPPRDLWARTSASLDREVARAYRTRKLMRRLTRGRRAGQPTASLMAALAVVGVTAAIAVLQLAPAIGPASNPVRPTPFNVLPQDIAYIGVRAGDLAVYRTQVSQVCPPSGPLDCVETTQVVRTPISLPANNKGGGLRAGNVSLNRDGTQLAMVGHYVGADVIAVVTLPENSGAGAGSNDGNGHGQHSDHEPKGASASPDAGGTKKTDPPRTAAPGDSQAPAASQAGDTPAPTDQPPQPAETADPGQPTVPPETAIPGLAVLAILEDVQSAGAPPDWSADGNTLAFSAMPIDHSSGPDVYVWSPGEDKAVALTSDHASFFASWSDNRIVVSRIDPASHKLHNVVVDPATGEQREVAGPRVWLPSVNSQGTQAIGWFGSLDTTGLLPKPESGALYVMDWTRADPFRVSDDGTQEPPPPVATDEPPTTDGQPTDAPAEPGDEPAPDQTPALQSNSSGSASQPGGVAPTPDVDVSTDDADTGTVPGSLTPLDPNRDPDAGPIVDWQIRWSGDGRVLGVWVTDSDGSSWGELTVLALDPDDGTIVAGDPLLPTTMARRGFSLGHSRVAWVGPSDNNVDGELRIRVWGSDGVGGLRLSPADDEEVYPAS
jgi:anti-sigma factor RsiW